MASSYTIRFGAVALSSPGSRLICTTPVDVTWVVRDVVFFNNSAAEGAFSLYATHQAAAYRLLILKVAPGSSFRQELRQTMYTGDQLTLESSVGSSGIWVCGYQFSGQMAFVPTTGIAPLPSSKSG